MNRSKIKDIKKVLMGGYGYIRIGKHTKLRMFQRGYTKGDLVKCILTGKIVEVQNGYNYDIKKSTFNFVIEGKDLSDNPIVVVLSEENKYKFKIITVMPPKDARRFNECI